MYRIFLLFILTACGCGFAEKRNYKQTINDATRIDIVSVESGDTSMAAMVDLPWLKQALIQDFNVTSPVKFSPTKLIILSRDDIQTGSISVGYGALIFRSERYTVYLKPTYQLGRLLEDL